jgi:two-component system, NtrC family, response regulator AtoC
MKALVVDDDEVIRRNVAEILSNEGWEVSEAASAEQALRLLLVEIWSLVFCDVKLSNDRDCDGYHVLRRFAEEQPDARIILMTGHGSAAGALDAVSSGAYDYLMKPFEIGAIKRISQEVLDNIEKRKHPGTSDELPAPPVYTSDIDLVGISAAFVEVMKLVGRIASTNLPVLITGESGTGKEIVARAIHHRSLRADQPFIAVNCGALPAELIESELFGHVRGSFTGATVDRRGLWEEADHGTVFLDEITETSLAFQVKLLRAVQEGEVRRVGSNQTQRLDVRVIAATNRDAEEEVREGRFRQDLLYRLNAVTIHLPPLRDRREDIRPLAKYFAERTLGADVWPISFSRDALWFLENYEWPGNIRELENAVVRAVALSDTIVRPEDLPERIRRSFKVSHPASATSAAPSSAAVPDGDESSLSLADVERRHILRILARTAGNKQAAARILGIDRTTLQRKLERYELENGSSSPTGQASR